jgi:hypothetical protein
MKEIESGMNRTGLVGIADSHVFNADDHHLIETGRFRGYNFLYVLFRQGFCNYSPDLKGDAFNG